MNGNPIVFIPLHKGADGFMSDEQFKKFYWPTLRDLIDGLDCRRLHTVPLGGRRL